MEGDAAVEPPAFAPPSNPRVPRWPLAWQAPVDEIYALDARPGGPHGIEWTINGRVFGEHEITQLVDGQWMRLQFRNDSPRLHPMHLHGQFFKLIARNGRNVDEPYFRDTVLLRREEVVDVALVPMDWGRWAMHCHILEHADAGMMTLVEVGGVEP
ncbi:MAG: multicopper oxidase domain-containing protein [bacterium]|nr:multicopper oxidase domain-containing protein [bacterium]